MKADGKRTVLFYSSVESKKIFSIQSYYRNDIRILRDLGYRVRLSRRCLDFACFWRYSAAFIYFYRYGFFAALLAKAFGRKVFFTGGIDYLDPRFGTPSQRRVQGVLFKMCNFLSDRSLIVSEADCRNVAGLYGGRLPSNCALCRHAVDIGRFLYTGEPPKKKGQYLAVVRMQHLDNVFRKGVDKAVKVFKEIHARHPESRLVLAGPPGEGSRYVLRLIESLGLDDGSAVYLGTVTEETKIRLMKESEYYFMLSVYEGFGITAVEALAAGCCLIHSGEGGLEDAAGGNGVRVDIGNLEAVADACLRLYGLPADKARTEEGIRYVSGCFRYETRLEAMRALL